MARGRRDASLPIQARPRISNETRRRRSRSRDRRRSPSACSTSARFAAAASVPRRTRSARRAVERAALEELAARDRDLLQELLAAFAATYDGGEAARVGRRLRGSPARGARSAPSRPRGARGGALRFRIVMVDEFQDTNALQCELVDLLSGGPGATRGASPSVTSSSRSTASGTPTSRSSARAATTRPTRSCSAATTAPGPRYSLPSTISSSRRSATSTSRSTASGEFPTRCSAIPSSCSSPTSRATPAPASTGGAAKRVTSPRRVRELVDTGAAAPGEIVLLFAAGTDAETYEEELRRAGLPTFRATGRGYFGQQQVVDLLSYLRLSRTATTTRRSRPCSHRRSSGSRTTHCC